MTHNTEVEEVVAEFRNIAMVAVITNGIFDPVATEKHQVDWLRTTLHHQLQKAREEEGERLKVILENDLSGINFYTDGGNPGFAEVWQIVEKAFYHSESDQDNSNNT